MVDRRKRAADAERQSQRLKRRRLNPESGQSPKPASTPTRTSPRLARKSPQSQKKVSSIKWEKELPNATTTLDRALLDISSRGKLETRDFCDEIADFLTQALFQDIWHSEEAHLVQTPSPNRPVEGKKPSGAAEEQDRENVEPNVKDAEKRKQASPPTRSAPVPDVIVVDLDTPSPSTSQPQEKRLEKKDGPAYEKEEVVQSKAQKKGSCQSGKRSDDHLEAPHYGNGTGGLVEEVVEIEEDFVDGGTASIPDGNKTLLGDVEEQVLDRSGSKSLSNSEIKKSKPSARISSQKQWDKALLGNVEEQVLDRSGSESVPNSELNNASPSARMSGRLPWWCVSDNNLEATSKSEREALRSYVTTIIRTCVRESWNAETLRESYRRDPNSNRGQAFRAVHASLQLLERARHMKECETRWRPELLRELLQRQEVDWSMVKHDKKFDHFAGCDACLGHRRATARIWLKGKRYESSDFWPGTSRFRVLSSKQLSERKLSVSAELRSGTTNDHLIRIGDNEDDAEFWVDAHCLRKCLLFHELVHSTAAIARDFRRTIERELGNGNIELKLSSKESNGNGASASERLERFFSRSALHDKEYVHNHVNHLIDIIRLGDVYFSSPDAEVLDSGKPGKSVYVPNIYDAPLDLGDEEYRRQIDEVVESSRRKRQSKQTSE